MIIKFKSFRTKVLFWYSLSLLIIIFLFSMGLYLGIKTNLEKNLLQSLQSIANDIKNDNLKNRVYNELHFIEHKEEFPLSPVYIQVTKISKNSQKIILKSKSLNSNTLPIPKNLIDTSLEKLKLPFIKSIDIDESNEYEDDDEQTILLSTLVKNGATYIVQVATPLDKIDDEVEKIISVLAILDPLLFVVSFLIGYFLIKETLSPMQTITQIARDISAHDLSKRVPTIHSEDEFAKLAETFNDMIARLEKSFENIKRFSSDASHELKTPLTIIRGEVEVALRHNRSQDEYKKVLNSMLEEIISLQKIIENLFLLTKTDHSQIKNLFDAINLDYILLRVYEDFFSVAQKKGVTLEIKDIIPIQIYGEANLIKILFSNLIDNAIKYSPKDKKVTIGLKEEVTKVIFYIEDEGIGIEKENLSYIFDRFYRVDNSRSKKIKGYGLGLSIVKQIVNLHSGEIEINSKPKEGTNIYVKFEKL